MINETGTENVESKQGNVDYNYGCQPKRAEHSDSNTPSITTEFNIPTRVGGATSEIKSVDENFFTGVTRKRTARYYLSGIDARSTHSGLKHYLESRNIHVTYLKLFSRRENARSISAKLNVAAQCADEIEADGFWLDGIYCRRWYSNKEWYNNQSEGQNEYNEQ